MALAVPVVPRDTAVATKTSLYIPALVKYRPDAAKREVLELNVHDLDTLLHVLCGLEEASTASAVHDVGVAQLLFTAVTEMFEESSMLLLYTSLRRISGCLGNTCICSALDGWKRNRMFESGPCTTENVVADGVERASILNIAS
jgi:hypothetical protein